jgi:hypothetical protein
MATADGPRLPGGAGSVGVDACERRWATPTGEPCPRSRRLDGGIEGSGDCVACGVCLLFGGLVD